MKAKLKGLSGPAIKGWFMAHGEKLAFGAAGLIFVLLVYKAVGREVLPADKEPPRLAEKATQATQHVVNSKWDGTSLQPPVYVERAKRENIAALNYKLRSFNRPIYDIKGKRGDPVILAAEGLRATAGHGILALFANVDPNAPREVRDQNYGDGDLAPGQARPAGVRAPNGSTPEGKYWAVITGLIPVKKQLGEYQKEFERAKAEDRAADVPTYLGFTIERAEIDPNSPETLNWQKLDKVAANAFNARWATTAREVVAAKFIDPKFTVQLPPLLGEDWKESVAHPGEIPLANAPPPPTDPAAVPAAAPVPAADPNNPFGDGINREPPKPAALPDADVARAQQDKPAEHRLFRFFDFTVEPGKQYRYRIMLGLSNPNFNLPVKYLKNPEKAKDSFVASPMSESTPVVFIPKAEQILAGPKPGDRPTISGEPEATVMLTKFDTVKGTFAAKEIKVMRGNLTFYEGSVVVRDPIKNALKEDAIRFDHNALVLDIRGGQDLLGRVKSSTPSEVLLLDSEGNIVTGGNELLARTELADAKAFKEQRELIAQPVTRTPTGPTLVPEENILIPKAKVVPRNR